MDTAVSVLIRSADAAFRFAFGDGLPDGVERAEGTDPNASTNYCCSISVTYTGIFQTTNALTFAALWGTNTVWGPTPVTTKAWTHDFGHRVATHGEFAHVHVWDDANHNGVWDEGETGDKYDFKPSGHATCVTNELAYGHFDRNNNNLPDWWEAETQLSADGRNVKEYEDPDGDGLINLHEFWAGTNPLVPDGSNTLLSVCARSIDDLLHSTFVDLAMFSDYPGTSVPPTVIRNPTFFGSSLDLNSVSVWNSQSETQRCATVVSPYHIVGAAHWQVSAHQNVFFLGDNGVLYSNRVQSAKSYQLHFYNMGLETLDVSVGILDAPLPSVVHGSEPILLGCHLTADGAPSILLTQVHIQRMMNELSVQTGKPSFELQYLDLSPFRKVRENQR